jgi:type IV pilus assembly protein PilQ
MLLALATFDLELQEADLHTALRFLADTCGYDVVVPDSVQGRVSVRLEDVRCDDALGAVLAAKGLVAVPAGGTLTVR